MKLLSRKLLEKTGPVDYADWNYRSVLGLISRSRFRLILEMMSRRKFQRLLEIGYGSGVFMPELAEHADELMGVDIHSRTEAVSNRLQEFGTHVRLYTADVTSMPFPDRYFDCIVAISTLEFIDDLDAACDEIDRVLTEDGCFLVVTPTNSPIADAGLKLLTGNSANEDFGDRRAKLVSTLKKYFWVGEERYFPSLSTLKLYTGLKLVRAESGDELEIPLAA
jgi:ubiquinone/menaquinone biosynthesis C-methylase UbiE